MVGVSIEAALPASNTSEADMKTAVRAAIANLAAGILIVGACACGDATVQPPARARRVRPPQVRPLEPATPQDSRGIYLLPPQMSTDKTYIIEIELRRNH